MEVMNTKEFKKAFWYWYDRLSPEEREKFYSYKSDMAELYFYNKVFSKIVTGQLAQQNRASRYEREG